MTNWYQQGDVMIKPVEQVPEGGTRVSGAVLAEGEATGHRHAGVGEGVAVLEQNAELRAHGRAPTMRRVQSVVLTTWWLCWAAGLGLVLERLLWAIVHG